MYNPSLGLNLVSGQNKFTTEDHSAPVYDTLGQVVWKRLFDRPAAFVYVKANAAIVDGNCLTLSLNYDNADVDAAATTSESTLTGTADFTADEFAGHGGMVVIDANGGLKHGGHYINRNSANILYTDRVWPEALTTASDFLTHMLNGVKLADAAAAATIHVCGVGIGSITSGNYGWIQVFGVHNRVLTAGNTDAVVTGEGIMASTTAGTAKGWTAAGTTAEDVFFSFGTALAPDAEAAAASEGVPAIINCLRFWGV